MARKILLADDSVTAQNMGRKILADAGYEVVTVNNGSAALKKVADAKPDLIVLDVYMPGYSGLEVCQRLKEVNETARIPILLTVGKLEPFKPEEAKRARADAFIVKPFEASELLSALTKLEDKIVPRPEASKPGRFARAIAAVEEGRYDKSMAVEEDDGWKNRIKFPSGKKKKPAEEKEQDTDEFYNPMNKDLRTTVEYRPPQPSEETRQEGPRVDLGALAQHGLPKDVTPEEIAALAAAAARIQGTGSGKQEPEARAEEVQATENRPAEERPAEIPVVAPPVIEPAAQPPVAVQAEAVVEEKSEAKPGTPAAEMPKEAAAPTVEAVAEQKPEQEEKVEAPTDKPSEATPDFKVPGLPPPAFADLTGAIVALPLGTYVSLTPGSGNGSSSHASESEPAKSEPVTMAMAAGAEYASTASRWMAVPVALLPEESTISLEQEMQKTYAALAAAEAAQAVPQEEVAVAEPVAVTLPPVAEAAPPVEPATAESPEAAASMPEVVSTMSSVATVAAEAIKAAVKEFETVAASLIGKKPAAEPEPEPAPAQLAEPVAEPVAEAAPAVEEKAEEKPVAESAAPEPEAASVQAAPEPVAQEQEAEQPAEQKQEEPQPAVEAAAAAPAEESSSAVEISAEKIEEVPAPASAVPAAPVSASAVSSQPAEVPAETQPAAGGIDEMAKKEKEIAATTAAAWASWRRIRETGDAKAHPSPEAPAKAAEEEAPAPKDRDEAAMAVAAGAEKAPEEVPAESGSDSGEIASIVDSVLADLRPKIVEEISKKLKKKK